MMSPAPNYLAVLVAGLVIFLLGGLWYSPALFAKKWIAENEAGRPWFDAQRKRERAHIIEEVGSKLRGLMSFLDPVKVTPEGEVKPAREEARPAAEVAR